MTQTSRRAALTTAWVLFTLGAALMPASAQPVPPVALPDYVTTDDSGAIVLSPVEAARWALERNTDLQLQATSIDEALGQLRQARALYSLSVRLDGTALLMGPVASFQLPGDEGQQPRSVEVGQDHVLNATLSATQPLYAGGREDLVKRMARTNVEVMRQTTEVTRLSIDLAARELAYGVLRAVQLAGVAAAQVTAIAEHVRQAEAMEAAGVAPHFDVVQANTELARAQEQLISAQTGVAQLQSQLRRMLALPQSTVLALVDPPPPESPDGELTDLIEQAWAKRPEVVAAETGVRVAEMNLKLSQCDLAPLVSLTGSWTQQSAGGLGASDYSWQVGVVAQKPLFDGGAQRGKVEAAQAQLTAAQLRVEQAREQTALAVVQQFLAVEEARQKIDTAQQGVAEARERRRMAQLRYREGLGTGIEVIDADTALAAAEASLVNAEYDLQLAVTRLRTATGVAELPPQEVETQ
ncbi:MAG: TolC family protein [Armatimonadota bacterium]